MCTGLTILFEELRKTSQRGAAGMHWAPAPAPEVQL